MAVIEAVGLTKRFGRSDSAPVLDGINLAIEAGEVFGYLGPNGAGKTTTIRVLLGLLRPSNGAVRVFGEDPTVRDGLRSRLGVLMENSGLDDRMTAFQSLHYHARLYGIKEPAAKIDQLLSFVGLATERNKLVGTFSTGMKRKLGLARSILHDPDILFLDEPSAGLDPEAQLMVRELLQELAETRNITVFINSHHLDEVQRLCTRIAILHRGRIRACDSVAKLTGRDASAQLRVRLTAEAETFGAAEMLRQSFDFDEIRTEAASLLFESSMVPTHAIVAALVHAGFQIEEVTRPIRSLEEAYFEIVRSNGGEAP